MTHYRCQISSARQERLTAAAAADLFDGTRHTQTSHTTHHRCMSSVFPFAHLLIFNESWLNKLFAAVCVFRFLRVFFSDSVRFSFSKQITYTLLLRRLSKLVFYYFFAFCNDFSINPTVCDASLQYARNRPTTTLRKKYYEKRTLPFPHAVVERSGCRESHYHLEKSNKPCQIFECCSLQIASVSNSLRKLRKKSGKRNVIM